MSPVGDIICCTLSVLFLALSLMGVSCVQLYDVKDVLVAWRRGLKKSFVSGVLGVGYFYYLEVYVERKCQACMA